MADMYKSFPVDSRSVERDEWRFKNRVVGTGNYGRWDEARIYLDTIFYNDSKGVSLITAYAFCKAVCVLWPLLTFLTFWFARRDLKQEYKHEIKVLKQL